VSRTPPKTPSDRSRPSVFWLLGIFAVPVVGLLAKIEIVGAENLPKRGPYVLAPNHHSEIDPLIVAVAVWRMGRAPRFMAKESLFHVPVLGWAFRRAGMVPVARTSSAAAARQTLATSELLVEHGRGLIVYPEGTLTRDPDLWPMRGKTGAVRVAMAGDIPLIPMVQWGTQALMPRYGKLRLWPLRKRIRIVVGPAIDLSDLRTRTDASSGAVLTQPAVLKRATARLMDRLAEMLADVRGIPAPEVRWDPSVHGQGETGRLEP
jgi:1-acyl-sn-glycerol-3-phosphate acyltransferase